MPIPFRCSSCGQEYPLADDLAGRQVRCAFCGEFTRAGAPTSAGVAPAPHRATSLHEPDLTALSDLESPSASTPASPKYAMDYIAPPPKLTNRPPSAAPPAPRDADPFPDPDPIPDLAPLAPAPEPALTPAPLPRLAPSYAPPPPIPRSTTSRTAARARGSARNDDDYVPMLISDQAARAISILLVLAMLAGTAYFGYGIVETLRERANVPEEMASRLHTYFALNAGWMLLLFCVLITPTVLVACLLACAWTKWQLPDGAGIRGFGTAAVPYLIGYTFTLLLAKEQPGIAIMVLLAAPLLLVLSLKELMGLKWSTTALAALLLILTMPVIWYVQLRVSLWITMNHFLPIAGLDRESIDQWVKEHPEAMQGRGMNASSTPLQNHPWGMTSPSARGGDGDGGSSGGRTSAFPSAMRVQQDPLFERLQPIIVEIQQVDHQSRNKSREELQQAYERLAPQVNALKPTEGTNSPRWNVANEMLKTLERHIKAAPSATPPPEIFEPVAANTASPLQVPQAEASEFHDEEFRFHDVRIRPLKRLKVNVDSFLRDRTKQRWDLTSTASIELELLPLGDPKQQRPWVADRRFVQQLAEDKNLLAFADEGYDGAQYGRIGEIGWTRITRSQGERKSEIQYVGRLPDQWLIVRLKSIRPTENEIDAIDKFVQGIGYVGNGTTTKPADTVAGAQPPAPAPAPAPIPAVAPGPNSGEINTLLAILHGDARTFDKRDAIQKLAKITPADAPQREVVASVLEPLMLDDAGFLPDAAAEALAVWHRPQTVTVLLPLLEEKAWVSWKRARAIKVLGQTRDKRAALPVMRWVLKDTENVVAAMIALGPAAEDEAISRLREKEPVARTSAARILSAVGTQKCLIELRRAANDPRDATAAAAARSALETVLARVKPKAATTTTAPAR